MADKQLTTEVGRSVGGVAIAKKSEKPSDRQTDRRKTVTALHYVVHHNMYM